MKDKAQVLQRYETKEVADRRRSFKKTRRWRRQSGTGRTIRREGAATLITENSPKPDCKISSRIRWPTDPGVNIRQVMVGEVQTRLVVFQSPPFCWPESKQKSGCHMSLQQQVSGTTIKEPGTPSAAARETIKVRCEKVRLETIHIKAPLRRSRENHQMMEEIKASFGPSELR